MNYEKLLWEYSIESVPDTAIRVLIAVLPCVVIVIINFRRWKRHYGSGSTIVGYYFRYLTRKRATDDSQLVFLLKGAFCILWLSVSVQFLF
jgi:hypothetical protein